MYIFVLMLKHTVLRFQAAHGRVVACVVYWSALGNVSPVCNVGPNCSCMDPQVSNWRGSAARHGVAAG
jgi:hypothetical protein